MMRREELDRVLQDVINNPSEEPYRIGIAKMWKAKLKEFDQKWEAAHDAGSRARETGNWAKAYKEEIVVAERVDIGTSIIRDSAEIIFSKYLGGHHEGTD